MSSQPPLVLVTGSSGLIGTRVVDALLPDHVVVGLDVKRPVKLAEGFDFVACDMSTAADIPRALSRVAQRHGRWVASVVHLAAWYDFSGAPSPLYRDLTVGGTEHLLRALRAFEVQQFVFSSTLLVVKSVSPGQPITEDSPVEPTWDFPRSKLEAEAVIRSERGDIPTVILRIAGVYTDRCQSVPIARQIARIHRNDLQSHFFPGRQDRGQCFVHLDDLADCIRRVIDRRASLGARELFVVGEPDVMTYGELQERIGELVHGREWATLRIPKAIAKAGAWAQDKLAGGEALIKPWMIDLADAHYEVDISHARTRLGWEPRRRLRDTLPEMIAYLERDPAGWYALNKLPVPEEARRREPVRG